MARGIIVGMVAVKQRVSVEEYLALPESEKPYREYANGEVIEKAMPNFDHGQVVDALGDRLRSHRRIHGGRGGPEIRVEFETPDGLAFRIADIGYWAPGRPHEGTRAALPPTLAIEVVSPDDTLRQQREKCRFYRAHGVPAAWLFDPETRTMEVYEGALDGHVIGSQETFRSAVLPGFELDLADLFAVLNQ